MKILHITHGFLDVGGLETFLPILINGTPEHQHFITIMRNRKGKILSKFNALVELINLESLYNIANIVRELKPDLIHIHYTGPESMNDSGFVVNKDDGKPYDYFFKPGCNRDHDDHPFGYLYIHDILYEESVKKPPIMITCHSAFPMPLTVMKPHIDCIVSVSNTAKEGQKGIAGTPQKVIYNGLDTEKFKPDASKKVNLDNKLIVLWVGHLAKYDREVYELLKADEEINQKCIFIFLGAYEGVFDENPLPNYSFIGTVDNVNEFMQRSDIFLYPSRVDSFSYAVAEAMASGLPVIASEVVSELLIGTGFTYQDPIHCIHALKYLISDYAIYDRNISGKMGMKQAIESFSDKGMINKYNVMYSELIPLNKRIGYISVPIA